MTYDTDYRRVGAALDTLGLNKLIVIGGNDALSKTAKLSKLAAGKQQVIFIPGSIFNDVGPTQESTASVLGFVSAAEALTEMLREARKEAPRHWQMRIIRGSEAGWLTLAAAQEAGAELAFLGEEFDKDHPLSSRYFARVIAGSMLKRLAASEESNGVCVISEGLIRHLTGIPHSGPPLQLLNRLHEAQPDRGFHLELVDSIRQELSLIGAQLQIWSEETVLAGTEIETSQVDELLGRQVGNLAVAALLDGRSDQVIWPDSTGMRFDECLTNDLQPIVRLVPKLECITATMQQSVRLRAQDFGTRLGTAMANRCASPAQAQNRLRNDLLPAVNRFL